MSIADTIRARHVGGALVLIAGVSVGLTTVSAQTTDIPNINGAQFLVNGTGSAFNCTNPMQDGPISVINTTFTVESQAGASFTASEVGGSFFDNYNATIDAAGNVSGSTQGGLGTTATDAGTFDGNIDIDGGSLSIVEHGTRTFTNGDTCEFTLERTGSLITDPTAPVVEEQAINERAVANNTQNFAYSTATNIRGQGLAALQMGRSSSSASSGFVPVAGGVRYQGGTAGDGYAQPWGVWGNFQYTDFENDGTATRSDGDRWSVLGGMDFQPWDNWVFGVALGYEDAKADTFFNGGELQIDGFSVVPYLAASLSEGVGVDFDLSFDMAVGYSFLDIDQFRTFAGNRITGKTDSDRVFFSGNLNAGKAFGNLYLGGLLGLVVARDDVAAFTESDGTTVSDTQLDLGQFRLGGDIGYSWKSFEPFASVLYENDFNSTQIAGLSTDDDGVRVGAGLRYFGDSGLSGAFEYSRLLERDDIDEEIFSFSIRADF